MMKIECSSRHDFAGNAAGRLLNSIHQVLEQQHICNLVLTGGRTPVAVNHQLIAKASQYNIDWSRVHFFWGDERCVPPEHSDSNFRMNQETLLAHLPVQSHQIHRIQTELGETEAAIRYSQMLSKHFDLQDGELPDFDIVLLGMGPDGHTASLFPGTAAVIVHDQLVVPNYVDKLGTYRITLTLPVLNQAHRLYFLVSGSNKREMLNQIMHGKKDSLKFPVQGIVERQGVEWWVDDEAGRDLRQ